jgi:hypothetical protein
MSLCKVSICASRKTTYETKPFVWKAHAEIETLSTAADFIKGYFLAARGETDCFHAAAKIA